MAQIFACLHLAVDNSSILALRGDVVHLSVESLCIQPRPSEHSIAADIVSLSRNLLFACLAADGPILSAWGRERGQGRLEAD